MKQLPDSLAKWHDYPQFILCNKDKVPINISFQPINSLDSTNWMSATDACNYSELLDLNIGFVITKEARFWFLDLDKCIDANGQYSQIALELLSMFRGAATEISISRTGLHFFGFGKAPEHTCRNADLNIEFYTEKRVALLTGTDAKGDVWSDWTPTLRQLVPKYFQPKPAAR